MSKTLEDIIKAAVEETGETVQEAEEIQVTRPSIESLQVSSDSGK